MFQSNRSKSLCQHRITVDTLFRVLRQIQLQFKLFFWHFVDCTYIMKSISALRMRFHHSLFGQATMMKINLKENDK